MTAPFYTQVSLSGFEFQDAQFSVLLAAGINEISPNSWNAETGLAYSLQLGLAVAWDGTNANQVRLAGAGDEICGRLKSIENRTMEGTNVGTVCFSFADLVPIDPGATGSAIPVVGSRVKGGPTVAGNVQACAGTELFFATAPRVVEIRTVAGAQYAVVLKI